MKLLMYTPTLDTSDRVFAFTRGWVKAFAGSLDQLCVVTRYLRTEDIPSGVQAWSLGRSWLLRVWRLWRISITQRREYDAVFVHMTPQVVLAGWIVWRLLGKRVFFWYAHGSIPWYLRVATWLANGAFSPNPASFRLSSSQVSFVGHGVDDELFVLRETPRQPLILTVGRITPRKELEVGLRLLQRLRVKYPALEWKYRIVGPTLGEERYLQYLQQEIRQLRLEDRVEIQSSGLSYAALPSVYAEASAFLSTSQTGSLDKAVLEALACGTTVFASGEAYANLSGVVDVKEEGCVERLAEALRLRAANPQAAEDVRCRHGLKRLAQTIVNAMEHAT